MPPRHCTDYSRAQALRGATAAPGAGLPVIEPGMPVPAGTGMTRRTMLAASAGLALAVYGAARTPTEAMAEGIAARAGAADGRVLVNVFMDGGADALSLLAPTGHAEFARLRPRLAPAVAGGRAFTEDPSLSWHPQAGALADLHERGRVCALPAIGYETANGSHFTSRHFWEVGATDEHLRTGWLGRYLDRHGVDDNPLQGLSLSTALFPSLAASSKPVAAINRADDYTFWAYNVDGTRLMPDALRAWTELGADLDGPAAAAARSAIGATEDLRAQLEWCTTPPVPPVPYPTGHSLPERLAGLAGMLAAGLPLKCVTVNAAGGYDTHASQAGALAQNLSMTSRSLAAFQADLEARGLADRVLVLLWSEFGRRPAENGSGGTDHGAAGTALVIGTQAARTMVGEFPGLSTLDPDGNLRATSDYRALYCALLEQWLGVDAEGLVPQASRFARPRVVRV